MSNLKTTLEDILTDIRAASMDDACKIGATINVTLKTVQKTWCNPDLTHTDNPDHIIHVDKIPFQTTSGTFLDCLESHFEELLDGKAESWCEGISIAIEVLDSLENSPFCKT